MLTRETREALYGVTIPHDAARAALKMGRDAFYAAMKNGEIPCQKIGGRYFVLGTPFRRLVGLPEQVPQSKQIAA
ncbi:hypothetical protein ACLBXB_25745 [Methylobacterium mesophilicum]